ncbi:MAG: hypothetical protein K6E24_04570, partial [bacterium]|nr:hypothetical protein [bacterium]
MEKEKLKRAKELYFLISNVDCYDSNSYVDEYNEFLTYEIPENILYEWELEKRNIKYKEVYDLIASYRNDSEKAQKIWNNVIRLNRNFSYYWEINDYINIFKEMHKKGIWIIAFKNSIELDPRDKRNVDVADIESILLSDLNKNYSFSELSTNYGTKRIGGHSFTGLLKYCLEKAKYYNKTLFYSIALDIIDLLIDGIKAGGFKCIRFSMILYNAINYYLD